MSDDGKLLDAFLDELRSDGADAEQLAELAELLTPETPPEALRQRLMSSAAAGGRLHRFAAQVAKLLEVSDDQARALLDGIDQADSWSDSPLPGVSLYHIDGGPSVQDAITGFICIERRGSFPQHSHLGDEHVLVLQGACRDTSNNNVYRPGDVAQKSIGDPHGLDVLPGPKFVYLAVVFGGLKIGPMVLKPGDPRI